MKCASCKTFSGTSLEIRDHQKTCSPWAAVVEARKASAKRRTAPRKANRIRREILGIETKPMPPGAIAAKKVASVGMSDVRKRAKKSKDEELRELMKPANRRRMK